MQLLPYTSPDSEQSLPARAQAPIDLHVAGGYAPKTPSQALDLRSLLDVVVRRWVWLVGPIAVVLALGVISTKMRVPLYQASTLIDIREQMQGPRETDGLPVLEKIEGLAANRTISSQVRLLRSPYLVKQAMERLPEQTRRTDYSRDLNIQVAEPAGEKEAIGVTVTARTPKVAADLANALVEALIANDLAESRKTQTVALAYIQDEMAKVGNELQTAREAMVQFKVQHEVSGTNEVLNQSIDRLGRLREEASQVERSAAVANSVKLALADRLRTENRLVLSDETEEQNPLLDKLDAYIDDLETRRLELRAEYAPDAPEIKQIDELIRDAQKRRASYPLTRSAQRTRTVNPVYQQLQEQYVNAVSDAQTQVARLAALKREIDRLSAKLSSSAPAEVQSAEMGNKVAQLEATYELLSKNYQTLRLNAASQISNVRVLSEATPDSRPVNQDIFRAVILSLAVGILLAVGLTAAVETLDHRIHTEYALGHLAAPPVLAQIPQVQGETGVHLGSRMIEPSPLLEQMRLLRSILMRAQREGGQRVIGITSPGTQEGKSTTAFNLAVTMALDGKRVILVDADLRRPSLHTFLGQSNSRGLSSVLTGDVQLADALLPLPIAGLKLLPAGPPVSNSPELLNAPQTHELIRELAQGADLVIIDTPPATGLSDVLSLVPVIDGLLVVVSASQTTRDSLQMTLRNLEQGGASILGFIYNRARLSNNVYRSYYAYGQERDSGEGRPADASSPV